MRISPCLHMCCLLCATMLLTACECGLNVRLGRVEVSSDSRQMVPYDGSETLVFVDQAGQEHRLRGIGPDSIAMHLVVNELCVSSKVDFQYEYYQAEEWTIEFKGIDTDEPASVTIKLFPQIFIRGSSDTLFYDERTIWAIVPNAMAFSVEDISDERGRPLTPNERADLISPQVSLGDTTLFGRSFSEVTEYGSRAERLWLNPQKGVIAFARDSTFHWVLDRIE